MSSEYFSQKPEGIVAELCNRKAERVMFDGILYDVSPNVFPSHEFRTTPFLCAAAKELVVGKRICDMGCGFGVVGISALHAGAAYCVFSDINSTATENTKHNIFKHRLKDRASIFTGDCFETIPEQQFDLIIFNPPFHTDRRERSKTIEAAIYDPEFATTRRFLTEACHYAKAETTTLIAYSNKGDVEGLERLFDEYGYSWKLWRRINTDQKYDNRLYLLRSIEKV